MHDESRTDEATTLTTDRPATTPGQADTSSTSSMSSRPAVRDKKAVTLKVSSEDEADEALARAITTPAVQAAATICAFEGGAADVNALIGQLRTQEDAVRGGDVSRAEQMLIAQAHTLDELFNHLARRARANMGQHLDAADRYLRLALKAQSQSRATWESLLAVRNPTPPTFVRQQNVAVMQQVNNAVTQPASVQKIFPQGELLEGAHGERLDP